MHATTSNARSASMSTAAATLDAELQRAAGDDHFAIFLRGCVRGGRATLDLICDHVGDPAEKVDEAPAVDLLRAMTDPHAVDRAVRAATWAMIAQRVSAAWPRDFHALLEGLHPDALAS